MLRPRLLDSVAAVPRQAWNGLLDSGYPFLRHEFLDALESTACVGAGTGWTPAHLVMDDDDGNLAAAAPLYVKNDSYGEFVFDFSWANAYAQTGNNYYPKLLCAVPYSPVVGPRLLARDDDARNALAHDLVRQMRHSGVSSFHMLFAEARDRAALVEAGCKLRRDCHYHWLNRGYSNFDEFLASQSSKRRKEIRRERRRVQEMGVEVRLLRPADLTPELLEHLYLFYARTYLIRGQRPYLSLEFFQTINNSMAESLMYFVAFEQDEPVGMAFMLEDETTLYGRHWGCLDDFHSLHFETCYYAGIEYCISKGLQRFDAGAQGEHKIRRGFEPMATFSAHTLRPEGMNRAVADFLDREGALIADHHDALRARCAFPDAKDASP